MTYFTTPLPFVKLFKDKQWIPACSLNDSIAQNLELIIMTKPGEHRYNQDFGCKVWNLDFNLLSTAKEWSDNMNDFISESVDKFEPRLSNIVITIKIANLSKPNLFTKYPEIKKSVNIGIKARMKSSPTDMFSYSIDLFLSPLSKN